MGSCPLHPRAASLTRLHPNTPTRLLCCLFSLVLREGLCLALRRGAGVGQELVQLRGLRARQSQVERSLEAGAVAAGPAW